jgi:hypothetical protein
VADLTLRLKTVMHKDLTMSVLIPRASRSRLDCTASLLRACAALLLPSFAFAGVLRVAPSGAPYYMPQAAIDAAVDGDTILIAPGNYPGFAIGDKTLAIAVDPAGVVTCGPVFVENLSSAKNVLIDGVKVTATSGMALKLRFNAGSVRIQNCTLIGPTTLYGNPNTATGPGAYISSCDDVVVRGCTITGGAGYSAWSAGDAADGIFTRGSRIALYGCTLTGGSGGSADPDSHNHGGNGGDGLDSPDSFVLAHQTTIRGGYGGWGGDGDFLQPGGQGGAGGHGVHLHADVPSTHPDVVWRQCTLAGGAAGPSGFWYYGPSAPAGLPYTAYVGTVRTPTDTTIVNIDTPANWPIGSIVPVTVTAPPSAAVALLLGPDTGFAYNASTDYALHVPPPFFRRLALGVAPPNGVISFNVLVPAPPGGVPTQAWHLQALLTGASAGPMGSLASVVVY